MVLNDNNQWVGDGQTVDRECAVAETNKRAVRMAWAVKTIGQKRCAICGFGLAESADKGCVVGNCSYRPAHGSAEDGRISQNKAELEEITGVILAELDRAEKRGSK